MNKKKQSRKIRIKFIRNAKIKTIIMKILYVFFVVCILLNILFLLNTTIKKIDYFNFMGISLISMESESMGKEIPKNSLVMTREYEKDTDIRINDNIAYIVNGKIRVNKVVSTNVVNGKVVYYTKSNNNYFMDKEVVYIDNIIGKTINVIPNLGILFIILKSKITTVLILFCLILKLKYNKKVYKRRIKRNRTLGNKTLENKMLK